MKLWIKLALKEIVTNRRFCLFFVLNLSIGLVGFIALTSFNHSLNGYLKEHLKEILTADIAVSSNRELDKREEAAIGRVVGPSPGESRQVRFYSMISGNRSARLARIIAIDNAYPLYGRLTLQNRSGRALPANQRLQAGPLVWMAPDLAVSLNLKSGETVKIGDQEFVVDDLITSAPDKAVTSIEFAPTVYIGMGQLDRTGLVRFGSRVRYYRYYRLPAGTDIKAKTLGLRKEIEGLFEHEPPISVYDSFDVNRSLGRLFGYFTGYMGLVGIVAVFLAGIGTAYLFRDYLNGKLREIAILMSLGAGRSETWFLFILQVLLLGMAAALFSVFLSFLILPAFPVILSGIIPEDFTPVMDTGSLLPAFFLGTLGSIIFCMPVFVRIHSLKPVVLLRDKGQPKRTLKYCCFQGLSFLPAILSFWALCLWQARSFERGTVFWGGFLAVMAVMAGIGWVMLRCLRTFSFSGNVICKIAFRNLYRNKVSTIACFVTIAMGAFLINLIPQLSNGIQEEIERPEGMKIPGFFLIDIQPEQLTPLKAFLENRNTPLTNVSPMIRGRITGVNGRGFYERIEEKGKKRRGRRPYRRREFNFSYRSALDKSETIVKGVPLTGKPWDFEGNIPMEISLEEGFAERFLLSIGDLMEFDIQGIPLKGRVVNLRKVRWNSFQPNFFILFQNGVLDDAPRTFLASIPQMKPTDKLPLQNALVGEFPNISVLDVSRTVKQMLDITDRLSFAVNFMACLAILAGLVVVFSIARHETHGRSWEINLLKVLGAGFCDIRKIILIEFGFLGFMAALFSTLLSLAASYGISLLFFDRLWSFRWEYSLLSIVAITFICMATAMAAAGKVIRRKPASLLQSV